MPYGIPQDIWDTLPPDAQFNARAAVESAPAGPAREQAKARNYASVQGGSYTPEVSGGLAGAPVPIGGGGDQGYDGGGGSGGGGGPAAPPYDVNADPTYQMFVAAMQQQEEAARANEALRASQIDRGVTEALPRIAEQGIEQRHGVGLSLERRGYSDSGVKLRQMAIQRRNEGQATADVNRSAADQKATLAQQTAQMLADLARQRAEKAADLTAARG